MRAADPTSNRQDVTQAILARFTFASQALLFATVGVCALDWWLNPAAFYLLLPLRTFNALVAILFRVFGRFPQLAPYTASAATALLLAMGASSVLGSVLLDRLQVSAFLMSAMVITTATIAPWGMRRQAVLACGMAVLITCGAASDSATSTFETVQLATVLLILALSVYLAYDYRVSWDEAHQRNAALSEEVRERRRAEKQTAVLVDIARETTGTLDRQDLLSRLLARTAHALDADMVLTFYLDPRLRQYVLTAHHGIPASLEEAAKHLAFSMNAPFGGRLNAGETVVLDDLGALPELPQELLHQAGIRALVAAPLIVGGVSAGRLVALRRGEAFLASDVTLFEGIARHLAVALEAADLYRIQSEEGRVQHGIARLSRALLAAGDLETVCEQLGQAAHELLLCRQSCTFLLDSDDSVLRMVQANGLGADAWEGLRGIAVPSSTLAAVLDRLEVEPIIEVTAAANATDAISRRAAELGAAGIVYLPLRRDGRIVAVHAALYDTVGPFNERRRRVATAIAQLGSFAIANAQLLEELDRANRVKSDFVATMSHELRSPLNVIIGYNDLMLDGAFGPLAPEQADTLERTQRRAWELLELINTTLDLSRMAAGRMTVDLAPVDVAELIRQIDLETRDLRTSGAVAFRIEIAGNLPQPMTDGPKLKVVLKNLVRNALKFTEKGHVSLRVERAEEGLSFTVEDTGPGIPTAELDAVFEAFRQLDNSITRRFGGAGLGLYIVRQLLDVLRGRVRLDSEVGKGSTFRVWVPLELGDPQTGESAAATAPSELL